MKKSFLLFSAFLLLGAGCMPINPIPPQDGSENIVPPESTTQQYVSPDKVFTLQYPLHFTFLPGVDIEDFEGGGTYKGDSLVFPKSFFDRSISDVRVNIASDRGVCDARGETVLINGLNFTTTKQSDAGAGNQYTNESYFFTKENICYRIDLFSHTTTPENYASNEAEAKQFRSEQESSLKRIHEEFQKILESFRLSQ